MKILTLCFLFCGVVSATSYAPLDFPAEPTPAQVLEKNGLAGADEETLLVYLGTHWEAAGYWLPEVTAREQAAISSEFFSRVESRDHDAEALLTNARAKLQNDRLADPRRIFDVIVRELGRRGTENSIRTLLSLTTLEEREWVCWKALASVQEILPRVDPTKLDDRTLINISADLVAPLLRDLDAEVASSWAWTFWERQKKLLGGNFVFRSHVRLRSRLWLAKAFAANHPQDASEIFREGLQSQDPALRAATAMIMRSGIGGSLPYNNSADELSKSFQTHKWNPATPLWETLPLPLDRPLLRKLIGGRTDLIWLSRDARVSTSKEDVWPLISDPLLDGVFYSRVGGFWPGEFDLSDAEGRPNSRIRGLKSNPVVAVHGGLWALVGHNRVAEFHADGSVLWECLIDMNCREVVPTHDGRVILLGYGSMECRDRRGDLLWKTSLKSLDDPRHIVSVADDRFLLSCGKSVGWLTRDGKYDPILKGLGSSGWIRYHPTEPWIIFDGGNGTAIVYDPQAKRELGRFDLDDGGGPGKSRFPFPPTYFPE
jgi:hypothetical protein